MQPQTVKSALLASALFLFATPGVRAQDAGSGSSSSSSSSSSSLASPGAGPEAVGLQFYAGDAPNANTGLAIGPWLVYPALYGGYVYNDNVFATKNDRVGLSGVQISPSLQAGMNSGVWRTNFSFGASTFIYPGASGQTRTDAYTGTTVNDAPPTNVTGHLSLSQSWLPLQDLSVMATSNFTRTQGLFGASSPTNGFGLGNPGVTAPAFNPSYIPTIGTFSTQQQYTNMYGGQFSVQKTINQRTSVSASVYTQGVSYDSSPSAKQLVNGIPTSVSSSSGPGGMSYGATLRGSFYATPQVYVFVQPGVSLQRFDVSNYDSNGYQVNVGAGSNLIGFFQGEVHGGWQSQSSVYGTFATRGAPSFGANIRYMPTPLLTVSLNFMQSLGAMGSFGAGSSPVAINPSYGLGFTQQVYLAVNYGFNSYMNLSVRGGWGQTRQSGSSSSALGSDYSPLSSLSGSSYTHQIWSGSASLSYTFWRNTSVMLTYSFTETSGNNQSTLYSPTSNQLALGYAQNLITLGVRYQY